LSRLIVIILGNALFIIGIFVLLWAVKRWLERRKWDKWPGHYLIKRQGFSPLQSQFYLLIK